MDDYYRDFEAHPDRARAVGWESQAGQAARFEVVAKHCRNGDRVLDLGAGLGDLGRHLTGLAVSYCGLERDPRLLARGQALEPRVLLEARDIFEGALPEAEVVAAIGCLVDGTSLRNDAIRFGRLRRLIGRASEAATRTAIVIVLDQDALERHPLRREDPALGGIRRAEVAWLAPEATVVPLLGTDLALILPGRHGA
jgi:SAM-dependent methyltransferase